MSTLDTVLQQMATPPAGLSSAYEQKLLEVQAMSTSELLQFDALSEAEAMTGLSYKTDTTTERLGTALHMAVVKVRQNKLAVQGDTGLSNTLADYLAVLSDIGFVELGRWSFVGRTYRDEPPHTEHSYLFGHKAKGILLFFDTYRGEQVNGGNFLYNWRPNADNDQWHGVTSSGHLAQTLEDRVWVGYHDCRQALRHNIRQLEAAGEFVTPWLEAPHMWFAGHNEYDRDAGYPALGAKVNKLTYERLVSCPKWVQRLISNCEFKQRS